MFTGPGLPATSSTTAGSLAGNSFLDGLGSTFNGVLDIGKGFLDGLLQVKIAEKIGGFNGVQAQTAQAQAAAAQATAQATIATNRANSSTIIPGVPNVVVYGGGVVLVIVMLLMFGKR